MSDERPPENMPEKAPLEIRDGRLKATLWPNQGEHNPYVSVEVSRTYTDKDGNPRDSRSFSVNDALRVSELMRKAYSKGRAMEKDMRREQLPDRDRARANQVPER